MAKTTCDNQEKFRSSKDSCCDICEAGKYMKEECDQTQVTQCAPCKDGFYTATKNHMASCRRCRVCSPSDNQRIEKPCMSREDTVCACVSGFFCSNETCDHCQPVSSCRVGEGVKVKATRTSNTVCAPCENGTYSNVTDSQSSCLQHVSCEDIGRVLKTPGTPTSNAICGELKSKCQWMLPAGLWSGLVLTALVLIVLSCWRKKRRSYRTAATPTPPATGPQEQMHLDLPLQATGQKGCCQDDDCTTLSCTVDLFKPAPDPGAGSTGDSVDSCQHITVSFAKSDHGNGSTDCGSSTFFRSHSEPQEDEWCGT